MKLTIFDANSPGLPTDKPKGSVELIQVGDSYSIARVVKTNNAIEPIRDDRRGHGRRTLVWVEGVGEPIIASRTERTILHEMGQDASGGSVWFADKCAMQQVLTPPAAAREALSLIYDKAAAAN